MPSVKEIVISYLTEHGYDGLCTYDCGCSKDNLGPCFGGDLPEDCVAGYRVEDSKGEMVFAPTRDGVTDEGEDNG